MSNTCPIIVFLRREHEKESLAGELLIIAVLRVATKHHEDDKIASRMCWPVPREGARPYVSQRSQKQKVRIFSKEDSTVAAEHVRESISVVQQVRTVEPNGACGVATETDGWGQRSVASYGADTWAGAHFFFPEQHGPTHIP